ncbi:MAG: hypothetical protein Q7U56_08805 [Humidesulfovibrio sp.]|nr:hypothetical protein [Humidesulfovibrio sp.]
MASRTLLLDADIFIYQAATRNETELEWAEDEWTTHAHASPAKEQIRDKFESLADTLKAEASSSPRTGLYRPTTSTSKPTAWLTPRQRRQSPRSCRLLRQEEPPIQTIV